MPARPPTLPRLAHGLHLEFEAAHKRWLLLHPQGAVQLNDSAADILRRCDGRHTVTDIVMQLQALYDIQGIAPQVQALLSEGLRRGWID